MFSPEDPCKSVHREKHTCSFYNPEPDIWVVLMVRNPSTIKTGKDGKVVYQYLEDELDDEMLSIVIRLAYRIYRLFHGPLLGTWESQSVDTLRSELNSFFVPFLSSLPFDSIDIFSTLGGIYFLPVDKNVYLRIQNFIHITEDTFPRLHYAAFLYREHLVWSGLEQDDIRIMYSYIVNQVHTLTPSSDPQLFPPHNPYPAGIADTLFSKRNSGFLTGPDFSSPSTPINAPQVWVSTPSPSNSPDHSDKGKEKCYHLIIYEQYDIMCLFLIEPQVLPDLAFYNHLRETISPQISFLSPILNEHYSRKQGTEEQYRYIYFNHMNLALKTSLKNKGSELTKDTMRMINEIHADFDLSSENITEVLIRTSNDRWVVGRKSDQREFYVIFDSKNANLLEINEEVRKLSSSYFNNIFID